MKINKNPKKLKDSMKLVNTKIIAGIFTIAILCLIVFAGPAKAFILGLVINGDSEVEQGKKIIFTATLDIQSVDKYLPVEELRLVLDGPETRICKFDITGKMKSGINSDCHGIDIKKIPLPKIDKGYGYGYGYDNSYGYGYGYGYGYDFGYGYGYKPQILSYEITIHTQKFLQGDYEAQLKALIGDKIFESKDKPTFTINKFVGTLSSGGGSEGESEGNFCGNNVCESGETTTTCPQDCPSPVLLTYENKEENKGEKKNQETEFSTNFLTGAVTGVTKFAKSGKGVISFISLIGLLGGGLIVFKKHKLKKVK